MLDYNSHSTEFIVLDFESANIMFAPLSWTFKRNCFPKVLQEIIRKWICKQENDINVNENYSINDIDDHFS